MITGESIKAGDVILGLPSSGVHSNGFSLVRKIVFDHKQLSIDTKIPEFGKTLGEELLTPTRLYPKAVLPLIEQELVKGRFILPAVASTKTFHVYCQKALLQR